MARAHADKQYQPCLLDRLMDDTSALDVARAALSTYLAQLDGATQESTLDLVNIQRQVAAAKARVRQLEDVVQRSVFGEQHLRDAVLRELSWLLSTPSFESTMTWKSQRGEVEEAGKHRFLNPPTALEGFPDVLTSVVNYGIRDVMGHSGIRATPIHLARAIRQAIERFEPRIIPESLDVQVRIDEDRDGLDEPNCVSIDIRATVWGNPLPQALYLRSLLDVDTGNFQLVQASGA